MPCLRAQVAQDTSYECRPSSVANLQAQNDASLAYKDEFERWQSELGVRVKVATRDTFIDMFDDDDELEYEPATTAAIILTGGDEDAEKAALMVRIVTSGHRQFSQRSACSCTAEAPQLKSPKLFMRPCAWCRCAMRRR
jgi:hypothetical protein